ncbi:ATP-binding protein [Candidatus Micrarchaeota archaeon]|nr:ATP-binding protein [Candidatus Micrarchaeota archaeon]
MKTMDIELINDIIEMDAKMRSNVPKIKRFDYPSIFKQNKAFTGIAGPKGAGKTVMLRQKLLETENALYISLDSIEIDDLYSIVNYFSDERGIKTFLFDEIHYYRKWERDLKKIYDYLNVNVYFTSSVSLKIYKSSYDLGRRVRIKKLYPFSLREYLFFKENVKKEKLNIKDIFSKKKIKDILKYDYLYPPYITGGLYPMQLEDNEDQDKFMNIIKSIIERDIPRAYNYSLEDVFNIKEVLKFITTSPVEGVSYSSISRNVGITKYTVMKYIKALEDSFILSVIEPKGTNIKKEPKILIFPPFRETFAKNNNFLTGSVREDFFILSMKIAGYNDVYYLKGIRGRKTPDYYIPSENMVLEIGGKSKSFTQFKFITKNIKKVILTYPGTLKEGTAPLISVGFL